MIPPVRRGRFMQNILNYIDGKWVEPKGALTVEVINPATGELLARTPLGGPEEVNAAAEAAAQALPSWRRTPPQERVQYLFKLRDLLKSNLDEISRTITNECGKTFEEAKAEMTRAIENVEIACGIPMMIKGEISEDIAPGIDELMLRPVQFPGYDPILVPAIRNRLWEYIYYQTF
jgi:malonate-semialdehyde dehydrogenase (acetylating)/methylmalonate-semialdehyde dehydrogenase